jgi:hypothetical protein
VCRELLSILTTKKWIGEDDLSLKGFSGRYYSFQRLGQDMEIFNVMGECVVGFRVGNW